MPLLRTHVTARRSLGEDGAVLSVAANQSVLPFQFHMLRAFLDPGFPFLPRPFSVYDAREGELDFLIKAVGPGTRSLAALQEGDAIEIAGPLGNGIGRLDATRRTVAVAGGVGIAPFLLLFRCVAAGSVGGARSPRGRPPLLIFGARSEAFLYDLERFDALDIETRVCTEDGSRGTKGRVTDVLREALDEEASDVIACGPDPMMRAVAAMCLDRETPCRVSLETFMACGYGVCNACAVRTPDPRYREGYRYDRCCVDGPVFEASAIEF